MQPNRNSGVVPNDQPIVGAIDLTRGARPKRNVGGPATPFGTKIAAVESFSRRILRTRGGAAPSPAGMVGPATEEAIERGLAYLAGIQNQDGSWSLQGHGTDVLLRSDSAATGLCLLAFQGAGYTHRQHQYASVVGRGLKFLTDNQRTNGDLYISENPLSDQNVALYSHGIAALALCEAYGMTQDEQLREAAQASLNYIVGTQPPRDAACQVQFLDELLGQPLGFDQRCHAGVFTRWGGGSGSPGLHHQRSPRSNSSWNFGFVVNITTPDSPSDRTGPKWMFRGKSRSGQADNSEIRAISGQS